MTKFHIFLESGARLELTPSMEQRIHNAIFRPEEKELVEKVAKVKRKKKYNSSWTRWTPEEDALIAHMVTGTEFGVVKPTSKNIRAIRDSLPGRSENSIRVRVYWLRTNKEQVEQAAEMPETQL